jgi:hypothetical protein
MIGEIGIARRRRQLIALTVLVSAAGLSGSAQAPAVAEKPAPMLGAVMTSAGSGGGVLLYSERLWRLSDGRWEAIPVDGPMNRNMAAVAFDTRRNVLVVFGGIGIRNGSRYGETWEWDGRTWHEHDVRGPGLRDHHSMVYDEARGQVVMYGGWDADRKFPGDTWTWDGTVWTRADTASGPGGAGHLAMAYDRKRERVVMFGGDTTERAATGDTWEWDGKMWHRAATEGPGPRTRHRMAYDASRGVTLLYSGQIGTGRTAQSPTDTWAWDGRAWTRVAENGPSISTMPTMAYDERRQRVVLFGARRGVTASGGNNGGLWEFDGARWQELRAGASDAAPPRQLGALPLKLGR